MSSMVCFERDWEKVDPCRTRAYIIDLYDKRLVQKKLTKREEVNQNRRSQPKEKKSTTRDETRRNTGKCRKIRERCTVMVTCNQGH